MLNFGLAAPCPSLRAGEWPSTHVARSPRQAGCSGIVCPRFAQDVCKNPIISDHFYNNIDYFYISLPCRIRREQEKRRRSSDGKSVFQLRTFGCSVMVRFDTCHGEHLSLKSYFRNFTSLDITISSLRLILVLFIHPDIKSMSDPSEVYNDIPDILAEQLITLTCLPNPSIYK